MSVFHLYTQDGDNGDVCEVEDFPADEEIVEAYEALQRSDQGWRSVLQIRGHLVSTDDARLAWARELKKKFGK